MPLRTIWTKRKDKVGNKSCKEYELFSLYWASLVAQMVKNVPSVQESWVWSLGWEEPLEKEMEPTPVFLPREFHGQRRLADSSPCGCKESNTTDRLTHSNNNYRSQVSWIQWKQCRLRIQIDLDLNPSSYSLTVAFRNLFIALWALVFHL